MFGRSHCPHVPLAETRSRRSCRAKSVPTSGMPGFGDASALARMVDLKLATGG